MSTRATRFLQAFTTLLERSGELTDRQKVRLRSYADLRNAIVHNPRDERKELISDPRESAVQENQVEVILDPPLVMSALRLDRPTVLGPRNLMAGVAGQIFAGMHGRNSPAAIIITEHGKNRQTPLGLCSQSDVASLLHALAV